MNKNNEDTSEDSNLVRYTNCKNNIDIDILKKLDSFVFDSNKLSLEDEKQKCFICEKMISDAMQRN